MYRSEKRSLYRFLLIYLLSTFTLFSLGSTVFYAYEKHNLLDRQREVLKNEGDRIRHELMLLQRQHSDRLPFPVKRPFGSALFDIDQKLIFSTFELPSEIDFSREYYLRDRYIVHIKAIDPYYLGSAYLLIQMPVDKEGIGDLQLMLLLFMLGAGIFFLIIGYFLGRLFIAPMRESIEMMNSFIQDTTHELNTPISTILTNLELIETLHKCDAKEEMQRIEIASKTLSRIYDDLTYLKLHHNYHRDIQPINLSKLLKERLLYFSAAIESKKIVLVENRGSGITLNIDRDDAIRLIDNLLSNAIKYNRTGGTLEVLLTSGELKIGDSGIGIEEKELKVIFERFKRANKSEGGFGIGLNIVYELVQTYSFEISIESKPEIGTEVTIQW
ncbi:MAG: HAMP domain-containing sensor histidine kinase [Campylobacterota bacterium]|nr:HAMP domain-containing sensor histidine kinase [Campylobacterota bacterium]